MNILVDCTDVVGNVPRNKDRVLLQIIVENFLGVYVDVVLKEGVYSVEFLQLLRRNITDLRDFVKVFYELPLSETNVIVVILVSHVVEKSREQFWRDRQHFPLQEPQYRRQGETSGILLRYLGQTVYSVRDIQRGRVAIIWVREIVLLPDSAAHARATPQTGFRSVILVNLGADSGRSRVLVLQDAGD